MGLILSLETSTPVCALALHDDGVLLAEISLHMARSHSAQLAVQSERIMSTAGRSFGELAAVAVAAGPGSYTGLRIGASLAKGICYAGDIPLLGIGSLSAMAYAVGRMLNQEGYYIPMMDARRMEVYAQVFSGAMDSLMPATPVQLESYDFGDWLEKGTCYFFGDGSVKAAGVIRHPNARFISEIVPSAAAMGALAWQRFARGESDDVAYFEPEYLKEFQATKPKRIF